MSSEQGGPPPPRTEDPGAAARERIVREIVADALARPLEEVTEDASLIDDLGAESIDFVDIQFRIESELDLEADDDELFRGRVDLEDPRWCHRDRLTEEAVAELRRHVPPRLLERLGAAPRPEDLPRLITTRTILQNVERLLQSQGNRPA